MSYSHKRVHFIGIGGIGMSALARWFLAQNWLVTGSDAIKSSITQELAKDGIKIKIGHKKTNLSQNTDLVVHTSAIPGDNPELQLAISRGIKIEKYAEALGNLTKQYKTIAIAGSHGKSSTTAIVASILIKAGMDPTVIIGTKLNGWNFRAGQSKWLVIEADEYKGAFWHYHPHSAIITNIDFEHVDFYKNLTAVKASFRKFINAISKEGCVILNGDNENSMSLVPHLKQKNILLFSQKNKNTIAKIRRVIKVPGKHNIMNALSAWQIAKTLGVKDSLIEKALSEYKGVWRRIEYKGKTINGIKLFDDYAHHPTEIRATLQALREKFPNKKIAVCFQPHQQRRLTSLYQDFVTSWNDADYIVLTDTYNPKGRDESSKNKNAESLVKDINALTNSCCCDNNNKSANYSPADSCIRVRSQFSNKAIYIGSLKNIQKSISKLPIGKNDILVMMGAGDIAETTSFLLVDN